MHTKYEGKSSGVIVKRTFFHFIKDIAGRDGASVPLDISGYQARNRLAILIHVASPKDGRVKRWKKMKWAG